MVRAVGETTMSCEILAIIESVSIPARIRNTQAAVWADSGAGHTSPSFSINRLRRKRFPHRGVPHLRGHRSCR